MKRKRNIQQRFFCVLAVFSHIACIRKALHEKQRFQTVIFVLLLLLSMLSVAICISIYTRGDSMVSRIDELKTPHTSIIASNEKGLYKFLDYLQAEDEPFDYYEKSYVYPYDAYPTSYMKGSYPMYIEGYVESDSRYPVLEGKALRDLRGNEIAVMQSYAQALRKQGIEPLHHEMKIAGADTDTVYRIEAVFDYPNFNQGYVGQENLDHLREFRVEKPAVAIGSYKTLKQLYNTSPQGSVLAKIRFHDYSEQAENNLRNRLFLDYSYITGEDDALPDFRTLGEEMNGNQIINGIFQFVSLCVTICLLVSSCFVLYAFMKRKLMRHQEKLSLMIMNGITRTNIRNAYIFEIVQVFFFSFLLFLLVFLGGQLMLKLWNQYDLILLFHLSLKGWLLILGCISLFLIALLGMVCIQIHSCFQGNLMMQVRSGTLRLHRHRNITYRYQSLYMALRDILSTPFSSLRSMTSFAFVIVTILILLGTQTILSHLYTAETFGLSFDYILHGPIVFEDFEPIQKEYLKEFSFLTTHAPTEPVYRTFLVKNESNRDVTMYHYYPGLLLQMDGPMDSFLPLKEGQYPMEADEEHNGESAYELQYAMTTRRLKHDFGLYLMQDPVVEKQRSLRPKTYVEFGSGAYLKGSQLQGFSESIINNGYISFFRIKRRPLNDYWYPWVPSTILRLKGGTDPAAFEQALNKQKITYTRYDTVLETLQKNNDDLQKRLYLVMVLVAALTILVGGSTLYANILCDMEEKRREEAYLLWLGWQKRMQTKRLFLHEALLLCGSLGLGLVLYVVLKLPYFSVLSDYLGLYDLPQVQQLSPYLTGGILLVGMVSILFLGKHRHRKGDTTYD